MGQGGEADASSCELATTHTSRCFSKEPRSKCARKGLIMGLDANVTRRCERGVNSLFRAESGPAGATQCWGAVKATPRDRNPGQTVCRLWIGRRKFVMLQLTKCR